MNRAFQITVWTIAFVIVAVCFLAMVPSLLGLLLLGLLYFAFIDLSSRRYRNASRSFNSAVRAVCNHDGAITQVALAFSKSGPLRGPCYEFARRLMMGQDALEAASRARVPLQLSTAVALQSPGVSDRTEGPLEETGEGPSYAYMPAYGQLMYLVATAAITCLVLTFNVVFIVPTMEAMFEDFFSAELPYRQWLTSWPAFAVLAFLVLVIAVVIPLLHRGHLFGRRFPSWVPTVPRLAEQKADVLRGLADAIDAGWPMGRALAIGHTIETRRWNRRSLERAMELIEQGNSPAAAIARTGWIDEDEAAWLQDASPQRSAQLLRMIADQGVRDADANLNWIMTIFFPLVVLMLGATVVAYAYGFFGTLTELIHGLS